VNHVDSADSGVMGVFMRLTSPQILTEVIAIACAGLIALAVTLARVRDAPS